MSYLWNAVLCLHPPHSSDLEFINFFGFFSNISSIAILSFMQSLQFLFPKDFMQLMMFPLQMILQLNIARTIDELAFLMPSSLKCLAVWSA